MKIATPTRHILFALGLWLLGLSCAWAQTMLSVRGSVVNMRQGPGLRSEVLWELPRGFPLQVLGRKGGWVKVRDFENDRGWVSAKMLGRKPHHIVKSKLANLRRGPGMRHAVVAQADYGEVLRTLGRRGKWVHVARADGQTGWVVRSLLWGW